MTIIKDQLIEAQLEVIDNASLPSGRPVGSVYYNKTTEKIQSVKQDGNLRNVYYEDEVVPPPAHTVQYKNDLKSADSVLGAPWELMLSVTGLIIGRDYKYNFEMIAKNESLTTGGIFMCTVNNNNASATSGTSYSEGFYVVSAVEQAAPNGSRIFTATTTTINVWAKAYTGSFRVFGDTTLEINFRPTNMYVEQLPTHQAVGSFT